MRLLVVSIHVASVALMCFGGCAATPDTTDAEAQRKMLELLMPSRIEIVEPFTRVKSFDKDTVPDGIELLLRAVNSLGNPGLMIVGDVCVELYDHVPASGDRKGQRLERWDVKLATARDQQTYWDQITQMYIFRLGVDPTVIPPAARYVLAVTYTSPLGEHLSDEFVIHYRTATRPFGASRTDMRNLVTGAGK